MPYVETFEEFSARHGNDHIRVAPSLLLFSDGARVNDSELRMVFYECQNDDERLAWQLKYGKAKLERATSQFNSAKTEFMQQAQFATRYANLPGPPHNAAEILEGLKAEVVLWREKVANLESANKDTKRSRFEEQRRREADARAAQASQVYSDVVGVSLD